MTLFRNFRQKSKLKKIKFRSNKVLLDFDYCIMEIYRTTFDQFILEEGEFYTSAFLFDVRKFDDKYRINSFVLKLDSNSYNEYEIRKKLNSKFKDYPYSTLKESIEELKHSKIIDDKQYASDICDYLSNKYYGQSRIVKYLYDKHISKNIIDDLNFNYESEVSKAKNYYDVIIHKYEKLDNDKRIMKLQSALYRQGFAKEVIDCVLKTG